MSTAEKVGRGEGGGGLIFWRIWYLEISEHSLIIWIEQENVLKVNLLSVEWLFKRDNRVACDSCSLVKTVISFLTCFCWPEKILAWNLSILAFHLKESSKSPDIADNVAMTLLTNHVRILHYSDRKLIDYAVEPLYHGHPGDHVKCPNHRSVPINPWRACDRRLQWSFCECAYLSVITKSVLYCIAGNFCMVQVFVVFHRWIGYISQT